MDIIKVADAVTFDVDSTVTIEEGIDELAKFCGKGKQITELTKQAMQGEYAGFDETQPTSKSGGKGEVIRLLKEKKGFKTIVHIGDGSTDLEASPPADAFIGFGGNVVRESVKSQAKWFITDFNDLVKNL